MTSHHATDRSGLSYDAAIDSIDGSPLATNLIWAKNHCDEMFMPLAVHMADSANAASYLWDHWVSDSSKRVIINGLTVSGNKVDEYVARTVYLFLSSVHDVGKACPEFQSRATGSVVESIRNKGMAIRDSYGKRIRHEFVSERILLRNKIKGTVALVVGGHHGLTPSKSEVEDLDDDHLYTGLEDSGWIKVQDHLVDYCMILTRVTDQIHEIEADVSSQVLLTALVIMADWIASNELLFPIIGTVPNTSVYEERVIRGISMVNFPKPWMPYADSDFTKSFDHDPRPFQSDVGSISESVASSGIMIIEVPMGEGKTEAALFASEILSKRFGQSGAIFALPTQATSDGIFPRMEGWIRKTTGNDPSDHTFFLAHGRSRFNDDYRKLDRIGFGDEGYGGGLAVNSWFSGPKKGILSDFVVGTVDNVLKMGLKQKHLALRHLALSQKVVIIDECHAYDAYMSSYLELSLSWLGAYHVPVIILSATLTSKKRSDLITSYMVGRYGRKHPLDMSGLRSGYPVISYSDGDHIRQMFPRTSGRSLEVSIERVGQDDIMNVLPGLCRYGGVVGIIVNTVSKAQRVYSELSKMIPGMDVRLLHSAFTSIDRSKNEQRVMDRACGSREFPGETTVIIGTQVIEQSLDLDFDILVSDLCPIDLLIQRIGRLHRRNNPRPEQFIQPRCVVLDAGEGDLDRGSEAVYGRYHLLNTRRVLGDSISVPEEISELIERAYSESEAETIASSDDVFRTALDQYRRTIQNKKEKAKDYQIRMPDNIRDISGWLKNRSSDDDESRSMVASVRDIDETVEVVLMQRTSGGLHFLPWICEGREIGYSMLDDLTSFDLAGCAVKLPRRLVRNPESTISEISNRMGEVPDAIRNSSWLSGSLFLILDEGLTTDLMGMRLIYTRERGLEIVG